MEKLSVKVVAIISNASVSTPYEWFFRDHFLAQQYLDSLRSILGDSLQVLSISDID